MPERLIRCVIDSGRPHGRALLHGVLRRAELRGGCRFEHTDTTIWSRLADELRRGGCDGLLCDAREDAARASLRGLHLPVVCVSGDADPRGLPVVAEDNHAVGRMAAEHLLGLGFRRLAFYQRGPPVSYRHREEAFVTRARASGIDVQVIDHPRRLADLARPVGVFAVTDDRALSVLNACARMGLAVPDEVAVIGVGNDDLACRLAHPTLTSIDHGLVEIGSAGLDLLVGLIAGKGRAGHRRVPPLGVVPRRSTDTVAADDPRVAATLRAIRANSGGDIADICAKLGVGRRALDAVCRRELGTSVAAALRQERIRVAARLLTETALTTADIAERTGLGSAAHLCVVFSRLRGMSPRQWRARNRDGD